MRVLLIGSGGREHALAWRFKREDPSVEIIGAPGNPGIAELGECVPVPVSDLDALQRLARERAVDVTIVGPEGPLAAGIVDRFRAAGLAIFGPTQPAAAIETSKAFAKQLMLEAGIPTALAELHTTVEGARSAARRFGAPVVVKASGLAAGKGVIVCATLHEADAAIDDMLEHDRFGAAGAEVLVEEFMEGEEVSIFAITDGRSFIALPGLQDHKRLCDHDRGPNTGGMGAYTPVSLTLPGDQDGSVESAACSAVIGPTLAALAACGRPFSGLLYAGLMITAQGVRVVEFNCRFGDPETQALMPALDDDCRLLDLCAMVARGDSIGGRSVDDGDSAADPPARVNAQSTGRNGFAATSRACVTTVLAAADYPDRPRTGDVITLPAPAPGVLVFHAGTARDADGRLVSAGGRVLAVSATGSSVADARDRSLDHARRVEFAGKQMRSDIAWREIEREQATARAPRD